jgi:hypothetical protein
MIHVKLDALNATYNDSLHYNHKFPGNGIIRYALVIIILEFWRKR